MSASRSKSGPDLGHSGFRLAEYFRSFIADRWQYGTRGRGESVQFFPTSVLVEFWTEDRINDVLGDACAVSWIEIRRDYVQTISILAYTRGTRLIPSFLKHEWKDDRLPLLAPPNDGPFGAGRVGQALARRFIHLQWRFCPYILKRGLVQYASLHPRHILPIESEETMTTGAAGSGEATETRVKLHDDCTDLVNKTVIFKRYPVQENDALPEAFHREVYTSSIGHSNGNTGKYLGALRQNNQYISIFEHPHNLAEFFHLQLFPRTMEEVMRFWNGFMELFREAGRLHSPGGIGDEAAEAFSIPCDINPTKILVFNGYKEYGPSFPETFALKLVNSDFSSRLQGRRNNAYLPPKTLHGAPLDELVWSLGCVLSEALVWLGGGSSAVLVAQEDRIRVLGNDSGPCFHDGSSLLPCVPAAHARAVYSLAKFDTFSPGMRRLIELDMLRSEGQRPSGMDIWDQFLELQQQTRMNQPPSLEKPPRPRDIHAQRLASIDWNYESSNSPSPTMSITSHTTSKTIDTFSDYGLSKFLDKGLSQHDRESAHKQDLRRQELLLGVSGAWDNYSSPLAASGDVRGSEWRRTLQTAADAIATHLFQDGDLRDLHVQGVRKLGVSGFSMNYGKLLKTFADDLLAANAESPCGKIIQGQLRAPITHRILRLVAELPSGVSLNSSPSEEGLRKPVDQAEEGDENILEPPPLETLLDVFTTGPAFEAFRSNLICLIHPPMTIPEALALKNPEALRLLLNTEFDKVAEGDYAWLRELEGLGYERNDIADLLLEDAGDSPWIFFTPTSEQPPEPQVQTDHHLAGCVHQLFPPDNSSEAPGITVSKPPETGDLLPITMEIQRLCGLGGVAPSCRDREKWNGFVAFQEDNSAALVSYKHQDSRRILSRLSNALELFCGALNVAQSAGLCCDSFSILRQLAGEADWSDEMIELCRVPVSFAAKILEEVERLTIFYDFQAHGICDIPDLELPAAEELLANLFPGIEGSNLLWETNLFSVLQMGCLSVQIMSMGLQAYIQGHVGPFHPIFLDTPLKKIQLFGFTPPISQCPGVQVLLRELTCVGDMLQGPVLVFSKFLSSADVAQTPIPLPASGKYDLLASPEDLMDVWGPGQFILPTTDRRLPSAIKIGGGIIFASDETNEMFHWGRDASPADFCRGELVPSTKIRIGAPPVSVNCDCSLSEGDCRDRYAGFLRPLGTYSPGWAQTERQVGIQAGEHVLLQVSGAWHRYPGRNLKQRCLEQTDPDLLPFLEDHWAVQVSLCTGVARRVPLREMVADLLPIFGNSLTLRDEWAIWQCLQSEHGILEAFRVDGLRDWLRSLDRPLHALVLQLVRHILHSLSDTGLVRQGKFLHIAWPYGHETGLCFEIDLSERETSWARLIADSEDCATFAYVTPKCLETRDLRCGGGNGSWRNAIPLLETAVMVCPASSPSPAGTPKPAMAAVASSTVTLRHEETYYFKKDDRVLFVRAVRPEASEVARLVERGSNIPESFKNRLFAKAWLKTRLRERRGIQEPGEVVAVLASVTGQ